MTIVRQESSLGMGNFAGQPLCVRAGYHEVLPAMHEQNRNPNLTQFKTPRPEVGDVIINHAIPSLPDSIVNTADYEIGKVCGEHGGIRRAQE